jgi:hypothetical protein
MEAIEDPHAGPQANGDSHNDIRPPVRCNWIDFHLKGNSRHFEGTTTKFHSVTTTCEHSKPGSISHDDDTSSNNSLDESEQHDDQYLARLLAGFRWLKLKNNFVYQVVLKQKQPDTRTKHSASPDKDDRWYRWVTVTSPVTLMREPGFNNESEKEALGWHQIDLKHYFNDDLITTLTTPPVNELSDKHKACLLQFRLYLRQPAPWPAVYIRDVQFAVERQTSSGGVDNTTKVNGIDTRQSTGVNQSSGVKEHQTIRMRVALSEASAAATRLTLQLGQVDALKARHASTRWRHQAVKEAAKRGGLDAVFEVRASDRYRAAVDALYAHER